MSKQCYYCGQMAEYYEECEVCGKIGCQACIEDNDVIVTQFYAPDDYKQICIGCLEDRYDGGK